MHFLATTNSISLHADVSEALTLKMLNLDVQRRTRTSWKRVLLSVESPPSLNFGLHR